MSALISTKIKRDAVHGMLCTMIARPETVGASWSMSALASVLGATCAVTDVPPWYVVIFYARDRRDKPTRIGSIDVAPLSVMWG